MAHAVRDGVDDEEVVDVVERRLRAVLPPAHVLPARRAAEIDARAAVERPRDGIEAVQPGGERGAAEPLRLGVEPRRRGAVRLAHVAPARRVDRRLLPFGGGDAVRRDEARLVHPEGGLCAGGGRRGEVDRRAGRDGDRALQHREAAVRRAREPTGVEDERPRARLVEARAVAEGERLRRRRLARRHLLHGDFAEIWRHGRMRGHAQRGRPAQPRRQPCPSLHANLLFKVLYAFFFTILQTDCQLEKDFFAAYRTVATSATLPASVLRTQ